jgi:hypothetical protein
VCQRRGKARHLAGVVPVACELTDECRGGPRLA